MEAHNVAMLKALVAVMWADDRIAAEETAVLDGLAAAFGLDADAAAVLQEHARTKRTLADVPLTDLSADDRRLLLQHAVVLTHADGQQCEQERALLAELVTLLRIPSDEADELIAYTERRVGRLQGAPATA